MNEKEYIMNTETETTKKVEVKFDAAKFIAECGTKSSAIRRLSEQGKLRGEIAKMLDIRYQHVRNVLITPIKKEMVRK